MASLPLDIQQDIAIYLDTEDLLRAAAVSKGWRKVITGTRQLWQHPHFTMVPIERTGGLPFHPPIGLLAGYLDGLSPLSLHVSGPDTKVSSLHCPSSFSDAIIEVMFGALLYILFRKPKPLMQPAIHLTLNSMSSGHLASAAKAVKRNVPVCRLSLSTRPDTYQAMVVLSDLLIDNSRPIVWDAIEIFPSSHAYSSSQASSTSSSASLSLEPEEELDSFDDVRWELIPNLGQHVKSLSLQLPEAIRTDWLIHEHPALALDKLESCKISGGAWHIRQPQTDSMIEHLSLTNLWGFSCVPYVENAAFRKLLSVKMTFSPTSTSSSVDRTDIAYFLMNVLAEQIEVIYLEFPSSQDQHPCVDAAWVVKISQAHKLREVTLVNYIPATFEVIVKNKAVSSSIRKLVLANAPLPSGFLEAITPDNLPHLELMDVSMASHHRQTSAFESHAWAEKWRGARIAEFKEPR